MESVIVWPFADGQRLADGTLEVGVAMLEVGVAVLDALVTDEVAVTLAVALMKLYGVVSNVHLLKKASIRGVASNGDPAAMEGHVCPRPCT